MITVETRDFGAVDVEESAAFEFPNGLYAFEEDKKNAYQAGMNGHIAKPIRIDALISALSEILLAQSSLP